MKTISMLLDQLIDVRDKFRAGKVPIEPKEMPLMLLIKELESMDRDEAFAKERIEELLQDIEHYKNDLDRNRQIKLSLLTAAESEVKRLGVGHVSKWIQEKLKE